MNEELQSTFGHDEQRQAPDATPSASCMKTRDIRTSLYDAEALSVRNTVSTRSMSQSDHVSSVGSIESHGDAVPQPNDEEVSKVVEPIVGNPRTENCITSTVEDPKRSTLSQEELTKALDVLRRNNISGVSVTTREIIDEFGDDEEKEDEEDQQPKSSIVKTLPEDNSAAAPSELRITSTDTTFASDLSTKPTSFITAETNFTYSSQSEYVTAKTGISASSTSAAALVPFVPPDPQRKLIRRESSMRAPNLHFIQERSNEASSDNASSEHQNEPTSPEEELSSSMTNQKQSEAPVEDLTRDLEECSRGKFEEFSTGDYTDDDKDTSDVVQFDELAHIPPCAPQLQGYSRFGKSTLRQTVIQRQSTRFFPPESEVLEQMEDQLVRWGAPQSAFRVDDILNGKHAFQSKNLPTLEVKTTSSSVTNTETTFLGDTTTGSTLESINKSPYINDISTKAPKMGDTKSSFKENNEDRSVSEDSILDSGTFKAREIEQQEQSASISSSIFRTIDGSKSDKPDKESSSKTPVVTDFKQRPQKTPEVLPVTDQDISHIVKQEPTAMETMRSTNAVEPIFNQVYGLSEDDEKNCWETTKEIGSEMWNDLVDLMTCNFDMD